MISKLIEAKPDEVRCLSKKACGHFQITMNAARENRKPHPPQPTRTGRPDRPARRTGAANLAHLQAPAAGAGEVQGITRPKASLKAQLNRRCRRCLAHDRPTSHDAKPTSSGHLPLAQRESPPRRHIGMRAAPHSLVVHETWRHKSRTTRMTLGKANATILCGEA